MKSVVVDPDLPARTPGKMFAAGYGPGGQLPKFGFLLGAFGMARRRGGYRLWLDRLCAILGGSESSVISSPSRRREGM